MSYSKFKFFFSSDEEGTFWPGVVELTVDNEVSSAVPIIDENKSKGYGMKILYSNRSNHSLAAMTATNTNKIKALSLDIKNKERITNNITPVMIR